MDGTLSLPVLGSINVNNLTLRELTSILTQGYGIYVRRPIVSVGLSSPRPITVSLSGEISKPGTYTLSATSQSQGGNSNNGALRFPTVTDIIQQAGGVTANASVESVQIKRFFQGQERMVVVDLWDLFKMVISNKI
ncbi:MAG: hypothetical protein HC796_10810 [Synechococcaceae cyanobacterium RL_1_2]|nr:hypothetical protein [Synechococcaceae cyanobacterium RL_1_2]